MSDRPLLTFAVLAYNQENLIRDAIEGAFSQTYSPLEIILSDDCSADGTFGVMQQMASDYRGPHRLIVNHNPCNLGLGGHINRIMELSSGALIVYAAGDDISLPERTSLIYEGWEYSGRSVTSIYSDCLVIDKLGEIRSNSADSARVKGATLFEVQRGDLREFMATWRPMVSGCTHAWSRGLFRHFGQLPAHLNQEDLVLSFRSLAIEGILYVNRPLVKYRRHDENLSFHAADAALDRKSFDAYDAKRRALLHQLVTSYDAIIHDIDALRQTNSHNLRYLAKVELEARRVRELYVLERQIISETFPGRVRTLFQILSRGGPRPALRLAPQLLPRRLYHKSRAVKCTVLGSLDKAPQ